MIEKQWVRKQINKHVGRIRRVFRWAAGQEMVPPELPMGLDCVEGLQRGRCAAKESEAVKPVLVAVVVALLPTLPPTLRAMVELQLLTGMRPQEVRLLRPCDVERGNGDGGDGGDGHDDAAAWIYRPKVHKTAYREGDGGEGGRVIPLGPKARAVLLPWLERTAPEARCFTPANHKEERYAALRAKRASKVQPSQRCRRKPVAELKKVAGDEFTDHGYASLVRAAAERAGLPGFHPNQIRHTVGTEVRRRFGLEAAQVVLGHTKADVTQVYAERDMKLALMVAGEVG
jgi:integrase